VAGLTAYLISIAVIAGVSRDNKPRPRRFFSVGAYTTTLLTKAGRAIPIGAAAAPVTTGALVALKRWWLSWMAGRDAKRGASAHVACGRR
jgi:hypothetical protein